MSRKRGAIHSDDPLFGYDMVQATVYDYEVSPHRKVPARLIIPGVGYFEGRSSVDEVFRIGAFKPPYFFDHEGYGAFYALDDSFRIIGPTFNEGLSWDPDRPSPFQTPSWNEAGKPETLVVDLSRWCADSCEPDKWVIARNFFHMASSEDCVSGIRSECDTIRIETRVPTILGPPGVYGYVGVVDLTKAPDLSEMLSPKWNVNYGAEPITWAQHFQTTDQAAVPANEIQQRQAKLDEHYQTRLEQVEAQWAVEENQRIDRLAATAQRYAASYDELQAEREVEARKQAATAAAIMGAFADLSESAIGAAEDLNQSQALVDRTNAASAGGFVASNTPYVAPPLTAEQKELLASRWGRSGGKSVSTAGSGPGYSGTSVSGSRSASDADEPKRITQEESEAIVTSEDVVSEDGSTVVTNSASAELETLASDQAREEEDRIADEARRQEEEARQAAEERRAEEERIAEEARVAEVERLREEERLREAERRREEERRRPIDMLEAVVVCPLGGERLFGELTCYGPFQNTLSNPDKASDVQLACGGGSATDFGEQSGYRVWGCGFGLDPTKSGSPNIDTARRFSLTIPERSLFRCPAGTEYCSSR